jgi:hypothetical protein
MHRLASLWVIAGFLCCTLGCPEPAEKDGKTPPPQDPEEAKKLLVGKWEGEWGGVPRGFEFKESGEAFYLTRRLGGVDHPDGKPVTLPGSFKVPRASWLEVTRQLKNGSETSGYSFTVTKDELSFYKAEGKVTGCRRVKAFSAALTKE